MRTESLQSLPSGPARRTPPSVRRVGPVALCLLAFALFGAQGEQAGQRSSAPPPIFSSPVEADLTLSRKEIFVGEPVEGRLVLRWRPPAAVRDPVLVEENLAGFRVLDQSSSAEESLPDGSFQRTISFKVTSFDVGERSLGPLEAAYTDGQGRSAAVRSPAREIRVASYLDYLESKGRTPDVSPVKPPLVWPGPSPWVLAGLGGGALALLLAALWIARRMRPGRQTQIAAEPALPPGEEALRALAEVEASGMIDREAPKAFYSRLSEILRRYLGRRYGFDALEMTSSELLERVEGVGWPGDLRQILACDTAEADSVKFARYEPVRPRRLGALGRVRQIVETTRLPAETDPSRPEIDAGRRPRR